MEDVIINDNENNNTLWYDTICKEINNCRIVFEVFNRPLLEILPAYAKLNFHFILKAD